MKIEWHLLLQKLKASVIQVYHCSVMPIKGFY